jgi:hypothetical protein
LIGRVSPHSEQSQPVDLASQQCRASAAGIRVGQRRTRLAQAPCPPDTFHRRPLTCVGAPTPSEGIPSSPLPSHPCVAIHPASLRPAPPLCVHLGWHVCAPHQPTTPHAMSSLPLVCAVSLPSSQSHCPKYVLLVLLTSDAGSTSPCKGVQSSHPRPPLLAVAHDSRPVPSAGVLALWGAGPPASDNSGGVRASSGHVARLRKFTGPSGSAGAPLRSISGPPCRYGHRAHPAGDLLHTWCGLAAIEALV